LFDPLPDRDFLHPARGQQLWQPIALIALQHEVVALDDAAAPEAGFERLQPAIALGRLQIQMLDDRDLFAAAAGAFEANDRSRDWPVCL